MSISNSGSVNTAVSQASTDDQRSILVLKKALDSQAQTAATLIEALPKPPTASGNVGRNVNTTA